MPVSFRIYQKVSDAVQAVAWVEGAQEASARIRSAFRSRKVQRPSEAAVARMTESGCESAGQTGVNIRIAS
jgi:hypothetical protein